MKAVYQMCTRARSQLVSSPENRYNQSRMTATTLRLLLSLVLFVELLLALLYLRRRGLKPGQFLLWGLIALLVPLAGPLFVIACRPGKPLPAGANKIRR